MTIDWLKRLNGISVPCFQGKLCQYLSYRGQVYGTITLYENKPSFMIGLPSKRYVCMETQLPSSCMVFNIYTWTIQYLYLKQYQQLSRVIRKISFHCIICLHVPLFHFAIFFHPRLVRICSSSGLLLVLCAHLYYCCRHHRLRQYHHRCHYHRCRRCHSVPVIPRTVYTW
mgnify:CR=1 FL=1